ncbi:integrin alpha [Phytomonospora sp. NPDC050363]|uniref:integrin alpha n=1 Tax=Phytomonospora sp. NPDC050363 TaxID=3155642 RepID=UPI00340278DE
MPAARTTAAALLAASLATAAGLVAPTPAHAASCASAADNDFDGDGLRDLAVGSPFATGGGRVTVAYSSGATVVIDQQTAGVPGSGADGDFFGFALASYDRDLDGCDDLVVGGPGKLAGGQPHAGMVWVIPGAAGGLNPAATAILTQNSTGFPGSPEAEDQFGYSVAAGNFGAQPYLAIGSPGETHAAGTNNAGMVHYQRGSTIVGVSQNTAGVPGVPEFGDRFAETLATTPTHIVVGAPGEDGSQGTTQVFDHRLTDGHLTHRLTVDQDTDRITGAGEPGDRYGGQLSAIAYRPAGGSTGTLMAVSVTGEDVRSNTVADAGMVHAIYVAPDGGYRQIAEYSQDASGVEGEPGADDEFGRTVLLTNTGTATYGTPSATTLTVAARGSESPDPRMGTLQVFRLAGTPGDGDLWIAPGTHGLPANAIGGNTRIGSSREYLLVEGHLPDGVAPAVHGVRWSDLLAGRSPAARTWPLPGPGALIWSIA